MRPPNRVGCAESAENPVCHCRGGGRGGTRRPGDGKKLTCGSPTDANLEASAVAGLASSAYVTFKHSHVPAYAPDKGHDHSVGFVLTRAADFSVKSAQAPRSYRHALVKTLWRGSDRVDGTRYVLAVARRHSEMQCSVGGRRRSRTWGGGCGTVNVDHARAWDLVKELGDQPGWARLALYPGGVSRPALPFVHTKHHKRQVHFQSLDWKWTCLSRIVSCTQEECQPSWWSEQAAVETGRERKRPTPQVEWTTMHVGTDCNQTHLQEPDSNRLELQAQQRDCQQPVETTTLPFRWGAFDERQRMKRTKPD